MEKVAVPNNNLSLQKARKHARGLLVRLTGLVVTGVALTAIGQPTSSHHLSSAGHTFWDGLFAVHLLFLLFLTMNAIVLTALAAQTLRNIQPRTTAGLAAIAFGIVNGILSFRGVHPALTLFFVGMATVVLVFTYVPIFTNTPPHN